MDLYETNCWVAFSPPKTTELVAGTRQFGTLFTRNVVVFSCGRNFLVERRSFLVCLLYDLTPCTYILLQCCRFISLASFYYLSNFLEVGTFL